MKILQLPSGEPVVIRGILKRKLFILLEGDIALRELPFITSKQSLKYHATDIDENGELREVNGE